MERLAEFLASLLGAILAAREDRLAFRILSPRMKR
jgi:hypothetical protein